MRASNQLGIACERTGRDRGVPLASVPISRCASAQPTAIRRSFTSPSSWTSPAGPPASGVAAGAHACVGMELPAWRRRWRRQNTAAAAYAAPVRGRATRCTGALPRLRVSAGRNPLRLNARRRCSRVLFHSSSCVERLVQLLSPAAHDAIGGGAIADAAGNLSVALRVRLRVDHAREDGAAAESQSSRCGVAFRRTAQVVPGRRSSGPALTRMLISAGRSTRTSGAAASVTQALALRSSSRRLS